MNAGREQHLMETAELAARIASGDTTLRVVDMRGFVRTAVVAPGVQTAEYLGAAQEYAASHLPGAVYLDWTADIVDETDPIAAQVAPADKIARVFGQAGIGDETLVVAYDAHPASQFATRLWWVMRYYGYDHCRVLNGGWAKWTREERQITSELPQIVPAVFTPRPRPEWRITAEEVLAACESPDIALLDARDEAQYTGAIRRGTRGGHIPGAKHLPREAFFAADGTFRPDAELQAIVAQTDTLPEQRIAAYCNGGVAATSVLFTLSLLGYPRLTNYDGSWNEWAERSDLPVTGEPHHTP